MVNLISNAIKYSNDVDKVGIGLYTSKQIVMQHNGEIGVSGHENPGSRFFMKLPVQSKTEKSNPNEQVKEC